jgi:hypothetical protein
MFESEIVQNAHFTAMLKRHLDQIPEERMAEMPSMNHAAWQVGHLAVAYDFLAITLGDQQQLRRWLPRFAPGTKPTDQLSDYPNKAELIAKLDEQQQRVLALCQAEIDPARLAGPQPFDILRPHLQTNHHIATYLLTTHIAMHVGQLSAWRKATGLS